MSRDISTELLSMLSDEEVSKYFLVKSGLEDLNLVMKEIEATYIKLSDEDLDETETTIQKQRLKSLEKFLNELNKQVNGALNTKNNNSKLS